MPSLPPTYLRFDVPLHDGGEDPEHRVVAELVHGDDVEMANEARRQVIPAAAWRAHRHHQLNVDQVHRRLIFAIVPIPVA